MKTSSVSRATSASRSAASYARTNFATTASSAGESPAGGRFAVAGRRPAAPQAGARPFERAVDRVDGRVQHVRHLARVEPEDVAEDEDGELARRQELEGGHEGQGDGLGLLVAGLRAERCADRTLEDERRGMARARRPRRAASARAVPRWARPTPWPAAGRPSGARSGTGWWRSGRARCAATPVPRSPRGPARRPATCPAGRPRRPGTIRASGSSARGARGGTARSARGTRRRPRPAPWPSGRSVTAVALARAFTPRTDTGRGANWAVGGAQFRAVAVSASSSAPTTREKGRSDDVEGQGGRDLRSGRCDRRRRRARLRERGRERLSHGPRPGSGRRGRRGHRLRRRIRRGGRGRRARRAGGGQASAVRDRSGGPRRHLVQRGRHPGHEDRGRPARRPGRRAVLPADHGLHDVVLPDRTPGRPANGPEQVGSDHDRHRTPRADGHPIERRLRSGARPPRKHSPETCRPSSRRRASAWSGCGRTACRRRARCERSSRPRHRA